MVLLWLINQPNVQIWQYPRLILSCITACDRWCYLASGQQYSANSRHKAEGGRVRAVAIRHKRDGERTWEKGEEMQVWMNVCKSSCWICNMHYTSMFIHGESSCSTHIGKQKWLYKYTVATASRARYCNRKQEERQVDNIVVDKEFVICEQSTIKSVLNWALLRNGACYHPSCFIIPQDALHEQCSSHGRKWDQVIAEATRLVSVNSSDLVQVYRQRFFIHLWWCLTNVTICLCEHNSYA